MILVADIGNTSITVGVYQEDKLLSSWRLASDKKRSEDEYGVLILNFLKHVGLHEKLVGAAISSVVLPLTERIRVAIEKYLGVKVLVVNHKTDLGMKIAIDNPEEAGPDRIVNAFAASKLYLQPVIVVDFGTATTFDIVSDDKFVGGMITAGIKIQADALSNFTSRLPNVKIEAPKNAIGTNTIDAMLSGLVRGHSCMIDGMVEACEKELGRRATVVATGGYSPIISDNLKRPFDVVNPELTLEGLRMIWELQNR